MQSVNIVVTRAVVIATGPQAGQAGDDVSVLPYWGCPQKQDTLK
jgi:hypothetical protein